MADDSNKAPLVFAKNKSAIVRIKSPASEGSGVLVRANGLVVTNFHVIESASALLVQLSDGDVYDRVRLIQSDPRRDLAILSIKGFNLPTITFADSEKVAIGEECYAIGTPVGYELTISNGIVSGTRTNDAGVKLIQITASISPGSSGGGLFNSEGGLIGITTSSSSHNDAQSINFSVPSNYVQGMLDGVSENTVENEFDSFDGGFGQAGAHKAARWTPPGAMPGFLVRGKLSIKHEDEFPRTMRREVLRGLAEKGELEAMVELGCVLTTGQEKVGQQNMTVDQDHAEAMRWFKQAVKQGNPSAQNNLGVMYREGLGVQKNREKAIQWFELAANQDLAEALVNLGCLLDRKDYYERAALQGHKVAQHNLGVLYRTGSKQVLKKEAYQAKHWFQLAADQELAEAEMNLGWIYQQESEGVVGDVAYQYIDNLKHTDNSRAAKLQTRVEQLQKALEFYRLGKKHGYSAEQVIGNIDKEIQKIEEEIFFEEVSARQKEKSTKQD
jgi:TPR repeat protein